MAGHAPPLWSRARLLSPVSPALLLSNFTFAGDPSWASPSRKRTLSLCPIMGSKSSSKPLSGSSGLGHLWWTLWGPHRLPPTLLLFPKKKVPSFFCSSTLHFPLLLSVCFSLLSPLLHSLVRQLAIHSLENSAPSLVSGAFIHSPVSTAPSTPSLTSSRLPEPHVHSLPFLGRSARRLDRLRLATVPAALAALLANQQPANFSYTSRPPSPTKQVTISPAL